MAEAKNEDGLFLLEALVDKVVFTKAPCFPDKDFRTCVSLQCRAVEPLEICDDAPSTVPHTPSPNVKHFNNGKSCLFSLKQHEIEEAMTSFPIKMSVYKALPCGCLPTKIVIGEALIDMTKEFVRARQKFFEDPAAISYEALKDTFTISTPDSDDAGEVAMFLRITCFGSMIITRFQGSGVPPALGTSGGADVMKQSQNAPRELASRDTKCVCGAAHTKKEDEAPIPCARTASKPGFIVCPTTAVYQAKTTPSAQGSPVASTQGSVTKHETPCPNSATAGGKDACPRAVDPYNSMPCLEPDDPCFCCGPKAPPKQQMLCRNTDQYCLHVPKGGPRQLPLCQELTEEEKLDLRMSCSSTEDSFLSDVFGTTSVTTSLFDLDAIQLPSTVSLTHSTKNRSVRFPDDSLYTQKPNWIPQRDTTVYMTLLNEFCRLRQSGTQATASVNKCLQAYCKQAPQSSRGGASAVPSSTDLWSNYTRSTVPASTYGASHLKYSDVYFFGRSNDDPGKNREQKSNVRAGHVSSTRGEHHKYKPSKEAQTLASRASSTGTSTVKSVSIKENKACHSKPCPGRSSKNGISATVSHIRIGPRGSIGPCPVHGKEPCCGSPAPPNENEALVKVTTGANPRRGVFEIVIRRITGAPLAKNELMLEWTPPPSRGPPCGAPCGPPCLPPSCRPSKCRVVGCRSCKIKCCKRPCKKPCAIPCKPSPCKKCCKPPRCGKPCGQPAPCRSCGPCGKCRACSPPPCPPSPCCGGPCSSVPCLRPCPVGRKKPRRCRSQPRVRAHRKRSSPCHNRSPSCPVVRCRSTPAPCGGCPPACPPPLCPPRRCCSVSPCKPLSRCSSCCK